MFRFIFFIGLGLLIGRSIPTAAETSIAPSTGATTLEPTCKIVTVSSIARLTKNPAPTCTSVTTTSTARSSTTHAQTSHSAVTEPTSTTQSRTTAPTVPISTTLPSTTVTPKSTSTVPTSISVALTSTQTPTSTFPMTTQVLSTTQPASQSISTSPGTVPETFAYAAFQLRSSVELSNDDIIRYIEEFVKPLQGNFTGTIRITLKQSGKLLDVNGSDGKLVTDRMPSSTYTQT
ncbi:integumentary mucin A.1-like [Labeo rohita]|uniref:integumentary mucin A.1-like n=1 Tax=Labeo rohita TaxID=84645 RepID=UPI0021E23332|nr:integumentary mucin A.1-like [Labeo rohita]